ncbi:MAG: hypothetical protein HOA45_09245, partial [Verrucomicrobia bacterium]|nr:hypothetical protein [Verrucomicrobiota bacterium]
LLGLALFGGNFISPKLTVWHQQKHQVELKSDGEQPLTETVEQTEKVVQNAERKFAVWHGVSQIVNLAMLILLIWRFWRITHTNEQDGLSTFG